MEKKSLISKRHTVKKALVATGKSKASNLKPKGSPRPATASPTPVNPFDGRP